MINAFAGNKNPGYMKENFVICIESLHVGDGGNQENVRWLIQIYFFVTIKTACSIGSKICYWRKRVFLIVVLLNV